MRWMFGVGKFNEDGSWTMPAVLVVRWQSQMETIYDQLTEREKDSDREQADKILAVFEALGENTMTDENVLKLAKIAFDAYGEKAEWKTWDKRDMPQWNEVGEAIQERWVAAIRAVLESL